MTAPGDLERSWRGRRILRAERRQRIQGFERGRSQPAQLRLRRAVRPAERPGHIATTAHVQAAYPFVAEAGLGTPGVLIGRDVYGGPFVIDPWLLYQDGRLHDPNLLILGRQDFGKCVAADTQILDPDTGLLRTIAKVVEGGQTRIAGVDAAGRVQVQQITGRSMRMKKAGVRVRLRSGRFVDCTPEHPLLRTDGWIPVRDLRVGETVALPAQLPSPSHPETLSVEEIDAIAILLAEGSYSPRVRSVGFTTTDPEVVARMRAAGESLGFSVVRQGPFGYRLKGTAARDLEPVSAGLCACGCQRPTNHNPRTGGPRRWIKGHPRRARELRAEQLLARWGLPRRRAPEKTIPPLVFRLGRQDLERFLAVLWMCDGSISVDGTVEIGLASEAMVRQIQHLLLRIGVQSIVVPHSTRYQKGGRVFRSWRCVVRRRDRAVFAAALPLWGEKRRRALEVGARPVVGGAGAPTLSLEWELALRARYSAALKARTLSTVTLREAAHPHRKWAFTGIRGAEGRTIRRTELQPLLDQLGIASEDDWIWSSEIFWDRIDAIEPLGPIDVYDLEIAPNHNFVAGDVLVHNSTLVKTLCFRQRLFGRRVEVTDPKGEYDRLIGALGGVVVRLEPGGEIQLNPLERIGSAEQRQALLHAVARAILSRPLAQHEAVGLTAALAAADARRAAREVCIPDVVAELRDPSERTAGEMNVAVRRARFELRDCALALHRLCSGPLRGMFDGPTNAGEATWDAPAISLNISQLGGLALDETAIAITMICATAFLDAKRAQRTQRAYEHEQEPERTIRSNDEGWRILSVPGLAEYYQRSFKLSRETGVQNVLVVHRFSDLSAVGDEGSRLQQLAEGVVSETATRVVYRQAERDLQLTAEVLGLSDEEQRVVGLRLGQGEALWRLEGRSFRVRHLISSVEWPLIQTDRAMGARRSGAVGR
jgi:intein/homing endonuclease